MKIFLENLRKMYSFQLYQLNPAETGRKREEQPFILNQDTREKRQNEQDFASSLENLQSQNWYKKLSPEQQENVENKYQERFTLQRKLEQKKAEIGFKGISVDIITKGIQRNISQIEDSEDRGEINGFEQRVNMLNRDIDLLKRELYNINLELSQFNLKSSFTKKSVSFFSSFKEGRFSEILTNGNLQNIKPGEIYSLKESGYDLSTLFLDGRDFESTKEINVGDSFVVNFGGKKEFNRYIGAGDLLPIDKIYQVKINGVLGTRNYKPRPGYYSSSGKYLAIYDNYNIEIVGKKQYADGEKANYENSFKNRYLDVRTREILPDILSKISKIESSKLELTSMSKSDFTIVSDYLKKYVGDDKLTFDKSSKTISTNNNVSLKDIFSRYLDFGIGYIKYKEIVKKVSDNYPKVSEEKLVKLINHENLGWDPLLETPGGTAYGLGQMIDSTWLRFNKDSSGRLRDRSNPIDQLEATCEYLTYIMSNKSCSIELAMAYYNTGEAIMSVSDSKAKDFYNKNLAIARKIPSGTTINAKTYFTGAVSYYNDISYEQASLLAFKAV